MADLQELFAERIGGRSFGKANVIYKFEKIKREKREALRENPGVEMIDFGVGQPDYMAAPGIIDVLKKEAAKWENRGYADNGIEAFKEAAARYMEDVFQVGGICPDTEVLHMIGSKAALTMIPHAFINPGDITLITVPGYPVLGTITEWLGGCKYELPLCAQNSYFPEIERIPEDVAKRAKLFYVNYPNNPTGQVATEEFYKKLVDFGRRYGIIIVQDAAYGAVRLDGARPLSILSIPGAMETAVEIHSLSKSYNMTGWRLGFAVGNEKVIAALAAVKDNFDAGQFKAIQLAGCYALAHPELTEEMNRIYIRRQRLLCGLLAKKGFAVKPSKGTFYLYVKAPDGIKGGPKFQNAEEFSRYMIREKLISVVPWDDAGHYVRFSLTFQAADEDEERRIMEETENRLKDIEFSFGE